MKLRNYSLQELEQNREMGSVWVVNSSKGERRGDVCLTVARNNGIGSDTLVIPATFIALDLTTVVSRPQLLRDNQFRQALASGLIRLVHPEDAEAMFEGDNADQSWVEERARLSNYLLAGGVAHQQAMVQSDVEVHSDTRNGTSFEDDGIPSSVQNIVQRVKASHAEGDLTEEKQKEYVLKLRNLGEQESATLKYVYEALVGMAPLVAQEAKRINKAQKEQRAA